MTVCQIWIGDGRDDYHQQAIVSIEENIPPPDFRVTIDDRDHKLGFGGAIQAAWEQVLDTGADYVFHCELDFTYNLPVPIAAMIGVLERHPHVVQLSLKRQPVNNEEKAVGDFIRLAPDDYTEVNDGYAWWVEQRKFFTTNPSLYRASLCKLGWPQVSESEGKFTDYLRRNGTPEAAGEHVRFGIWGRKWDTPRVHHIGDERTGTGY